MPVATSQLTAHINEYGTAILTISKNTTESTSHRRSAVEHRQSGLHFESAIPSLDTKISQHAICVIASKTLTVSVYEAAGKNPASHIPNITLVTMSVS